MIRPSQICRGCGCKITGVHACPGPWCSNHWGNPTEKEWLDGRMKCRSCQQVVEFSGDDHLQHYSNLENRPFRADHIAHLKVHAKKNKRWTPNGWITVESRGMLSAH